MDHYTSERLMLEAFQARARVAEERARLFPEIAGRTSVRWWVASRLRTMADRLDGRTAPTLRVVQ